MKKFTQIFLALNFAIGFLALTVMAESAAVKGAKVDYESFKKDMSEKLANVDQKLTELKAKAQVNGARVSQKTINEFENNRAKISTRLSELKNEGQSSWTNLKEGIAKSVADLNKKVQEAMK